MLLAAQCHLGTKNLHPACERYVHSRRSDGIHVINVAKTWDKLQLAARIIVAIENPADIAVLSSRPFGQRAALKFAHYTGAKALAGRHTPGELIVVVADGESGEGAERERGSEREKEKRRSTQGGCRSLRCSRRRCSRVWSLPNSSPRGAFPSTLLPDAGSAGRHGSQSRGVFLIDSSPGRRMRGGRGDDDKEESQTAAGGGGVPLLRLPLSLSLSLAGPPLALSRYRAGRLQRRNTSATHRAIEIDTKRLEGEA